MKKMFALALVATFAFSMAACSKKESAQDTDGETATESVAATDSGEAVSVEEIATLLSKAVCERLVTCEESAGLTAADCAAGLKKDLEGLPAEKVATIQKPMLETCVAAITKSSCEDLQQPNPPAGCEFIQ